MSIKNIEDYIPESIPFINAKIPKHRDDWAAYERDILEHRIRVREELSDPVYGTRVQIRELARVTLSGLYWLATYGAIYEARPDDDADPDEEYPEDEPPRSSVIPFIPYPFQCGWWEWFWNDMMRSRGAEGDGLNVKARDMGLSNLACAAAAYGWMTRKPFQVRMLSRVERLVDATGDPDSLFWKVSLVLSAQPSWMLQHFAPGFDWSKHRMVMKFINPANMNTITGESTQSNAGRGGRASLIIYDEAAFMPKFGAIWTAGRASTRHRLAISTVSVDEGLDFKNLHQGNEGYTQPNVLEIPYHLHPNHDEEWLAREYERDTEEGIRREVFMDYFAGTGQWVYPETHGMSLQSHDFNPWDGPIFVAIDEGFTDSWAIHWIQYHSATGRLKLLRSYHNSGQRLDFYGTLMTGIARSDFQYGAEELELMQWTRSLPGCTYIGDAHGDNVEQISGTSPYMRLATEFGITVNVDWTKRQSRDRRIALGAILPMLDICDGRGTSYTLSALQQHRYKKYKDGQEITFEAKAPIHDWTSHPVSALEYFAIYWNDFGALTRNQKRVSRGRPHAG